MRYPESWFVSGPDGLDENCKDISPSVSEVVFAKKELESCGFFIHSFPNFEVDFSVLITYPWNSIEDRLSDRPNEKVKFAGIDAVRYIATDKSDRPDILASRIYFNHGNRGFIIYLKQTDHIGSYDPLYDKILSTFQFFEPTEGLEERLTSVPSKNTPLPTPLLPPPSQFSSKVVIVSPTSSTTWTIGSKHTISWSTVGVDKVRISTSVGGKDLGTSLEVDAILGEYANFIVPDMSSFGKTAPYLVTVWVYDPADSKDPGSRVTFMAVE